MSYLIREGIHLPIILCKCQTVVSFFKRLDLYEQKNLQKIWTTSHLGCRNLPGLFVCVNVSQKCGQLNPWYWMAYSISRSWAAGIWTCSKLSDWDHAHTFKKHSSTPCCPPNSQNKTRILQKPVHLLEAAFQPGMDDRVLKIACCGLLQEG